jgi:hypothetical protein
VENDDDDDDEIEAHKVRQKIKKKISPWKSFKIVERF